MAPDVAGIASAGFPMAVLNRWVVTSDNPMETVASLSALPLSEIKQKPAAGIVPGADLVQIFEARQPYLAYISILLGNYGTRPTCTLRVTVEALGFDDAASNYWRLLHAVEIEGRTIFDNEPLVIYLPPAESPAGTFFKLRLSSTDASTGNVLTAWLHAADKRIPGHWECFSGPVDWGAFGLMAELGYAPPLAPTKVPTGLLISPVTQCNLNCIHCISRSTRTRLSRLDEGLRTEIRRWCATDEVKMIATDYSGDLLWANHRFGGELDFITGLNVPFHIDTNGAYLTADITPQLLQSQLRSLNVSLDAASPATYRRIRRGAPPLETVLGHIAAFSGAVAASERKNNLRLSMGFTLMAGNLDELPDFLRLAAALKVGTVICRHLEAYTADMESESLLLDPERYNAMRRQIVALAETLRLEICLPSEFVDLPHEEGHLPCLEPWRSAVVLGNGDVAACCIPGTVLGNLHTQTMEEIWQGENYRQFRRAVNSSEPPAPCRACPIYRKRNNRLSHLPYRATATTKNATPFFEVARGFALSQPWAAK